MCLLHTTMPITYTSRFAHARNHTRMNEINLIGHVLILAANH